MLVKGRYRMYFLNGKYRMGNNRYHASRWLVEAGWNSFRICIISNMSDNMLMSLKQPWNSFRVVSVFCFSFISHCKSSWNCVLFQFYFSFILPVLCKSRLSGMIISQTTHSSNDEYHRLVTRSRRPPRRHSLFHHIFHLSPDTSAHRALSLCIDVSTGVPPAEN